VLSDVHPEPNQTPKLSWRPTPSSLILWAASASTLTVIIKLQSHRYQLASIFEVPSVSPFRRCLGVSRCVISNALNALPVAGGIVAVCVFSLSSSAQLPNVSNLTTSNSAATPLPPTAVTGRVINGRYRTSGPPALVHLNNRSILTDHEGKFDFEQVTETNGGLFVTKPGFAMTNDPGATIISDLPDEPAYRSGRGKALS